VDIAVRTLGIPGLQRKWRKEQDREETPQAMGKARTRLDGSRKVKKK
jgi:hypothetical protein